MKKRWFKSTMIAIIAALFLTGCGESTGSYSSYDSAAVESYMDEKSYYDTSDIYSSSAESSSDTTETTEVSDPAAATNRKLIKTMDYSVETTDLDSLIQNLTSRINALGGYIESSEISNDSRSYYDYDYDRAGRVTGKKEVRERSAYYTIRIPQENLDDFAAQVHEQTNVLSESLTTRDITLQYVNTDAEREALETEYQSLTRMMEQAETVEEMIMIEDALKDVNAQLRSINSQLKLYDNQVTYSTVNLTIHETNVLTVIPESEPTWTQRIAEGFAESCSEFVYRFQELFIGIISNLPMILYYVILLILLVLIVRLILKLIRKFSGKPSILSRKGKKTRRKKVDTNLTMQENTTGAETAPDTDRATNQDSDPTSL